MTQIVNATCINGELVLEEKLNPELEGKHLKLRIMEIKDVEEESSEARAERIRQFLERAEKRPVVKLPPDYKFDRDEIYDR
jgi:hypothetical protein